MATGASRARDSTISAETARAERTQRRSTYSMALSDARREKRVTLSSINGSDTESRPLLSSKKALKAHTKSDLAKK